MSACMGVLWQYLLVLRTFHASVSLLDAAIPVERKDTHNTAILQPVSKELPSISCAHLRVNEVMVKNRICSAYVWDMVHYQVKTGHLKRIYNTNQPMITY